MPSKSLMTSRMFHGPTRQRYRRFKVNFAQTAREDNGPLLERIDTAEDRVTSARAEVQFREEKLQEAKSEEKADIAEFQSLNDTMTDLVLGTNDPLIIIWNDTMAMTRRNEQHQQKEFEELIGHLLQKVTNWKNRVTDIRVAENITPKP